MAGVVKLKAQVEEKSHQRSNHQNGPAIQDIIDNTMPDTKQWPPCRSNIIYHFPLRL